MAAVVEAGSGLRRARAGDGVAGGLLARMIADRTTTGAFAGAPLSSIGAWRGERSIDVDQANDSTVVGGRAVVKRYVRVAPGNERPIVLPAHLVARGFTELPTPLGNVTWRAGDGAVAVASATAYLEDARDGWDWFVELVERGEDDRSFEPTLEAAVSMGQVTARLHAALAAPTDVLPAPRGAASADTVAGWRRDAERDLDRALATIDGAEGTRIRRVAPQVKAELRALRAETTPTIPIHGDLHVGQFLGARGHRRLRPGRGPARPRRARGVAGQGRRVPDPVARPRGTDRRTTPARALARCLDPRRRGGVPRGLPGRARRPRRPRPLRRSPPSAVPRGPGAARVRLRVPLPPGLAVRAGRRASGVAGSDVVGGSRRRSDS